MRAAAALVVALAACTDVVEHGVSVETRLEPPCNAADALDPDTWRVRAFAGAAELWSRSFPAFPPAIALAAGGAYRLEVEAVRDGVVIGRGTSLRFDVAAAPPAPVELAVRPVGRLVRWCGQLQRARFGHSATLLADGAVLIAGGVGATGTALASLERVAAVGAHEVGQLALNVQGNATPLPRSFHAALRLPGGQVLFSGGEQPSPASTTLVSSIVIADPALDFAIGVVGPSGAPWPARSRHGAFLDGNTVLLAGGVTRQSGGVSGATTVDRLDLTTNQPGAGLAVSSPTADPAVTVTSDAVVFAGGVAGATTSDSVRFVDKRSGASREVRLATQRSEAAIVPLGGALLVFAGRDALGDFVERAEWVGATGAATAGPLLHPRARPCVVTLVDGRALVFGGLGTAGPSAMLEIISPDGSVVSFSDPGVPGRFDHTCTRLDDGSVLIAGGRTTAGPSSDLWVFAP